MCDNVEEDLVKMDVMKVSEEDLRQMKRDREKMSEEFQHFLQVNLKKSTHDDNKSQIECEQSQQKVQNSLNVTQVVRNLNESPRSPLCHLSPHASDRMKTQHGISSSEMMSIRESPLKTVKSSGGAEEKKKIPPHGERTADDSCKKMKNYDPIETRRYMRDQQKKRQVELKKTLTCDQARKLEIQKRLADLQENTKRILGRNVKQKVMGKKPDSGVIVGKNANASKGSQKVVAKIPIKGNNTVNKSPRTSATENRGNFHHVRIVGTPKVPQGVNTNDLDKNQPSYRDKSHKFHDKSNGGKVPLGESGKEIEGESGIERRPVEKLQVPQHLKLYSLKDEKKKKPSGDNLPHWLRPTPVNIYPYNFITAVREKLDAISNAQLPEKFSITHLKNIPKDVSASSESKSCDSRKIPDKWTDINRWTLQQEYNAKRGRNLEDTQKSQNPKQKVPNTRSISDGLLTNFSSISLHLPESNTISDISSIQSEIFPSSIRLSSTKISRSERASVSDGEKSPEASPETNISASSSRSVKGAAECIAPAARDNNQLSPLSAELADTMRIMSQPGKRVEEVVIAKEQPNDDGNSNNEGGGKIGEFRSLSSDKFQPLDTSANRQEIHEGNLTDLLEAFNRSLSQVIQMNQQLYSALSKSPNATQQLVKNPQSNVEEVIIAPKVTEHAEKSPEYDDSFEDVNSTVKSIPRDDQKLPGDDATAALRESVREIDGSEGVDKSGEIDLGPGTVNCRANKSTEEGNGLEARVIDGNLMDARETNSTIGSDIFAVFNQTDMEVSYISSAGDEARETSITYSNIGLMIQTEKLKGDHLMTMIRMREKALIDRTRGQIAWLELQKKRFREKGRILEISAIRKKQRAILLKLERERAELHRQLRTQTHTMMARNSPSHRVKVVEKTISNVVSLRRSPVPSEHRGAIKGYEIEAGSTLEKLLEQREKELQKRREHVEFLLQWHQRLEKEEKDVQEIEKKLLNSNLERLTEKPEKNLPALTEKAEVEQEDEKMKRVENIDKSLQILQNIVEESGSEGDFVDVRGVKLNNLWKKLVGREEEKFQPRNVYKMTKTDFSQLYEEAKLRIIKEFHDEKKMQQLLEESLASATRESNSQESEEEKSQGSGNISQDYSTDDFETATSVKETATDPPQENQQKVLEESQEESSKNSQEPNSQVEESHTSSEKSSNQSEAPAEDSIHEESTEMSRNVETYQDSAQESIHSVEEGFRLEILNEAEEEQLISEMTLPSFSETTFVEESTVEEIEGFEVNVQIQDRSSENISNFPEEEAEVNCQDSDLSVNSKSENFDNISQESLNTIQESVSIDSPEDDAGGKEIPSELEKRIIQIDVSLKDLNSTMEKSPILEALSPRDDSSASSPEVSLQSSSEESRASTSSERSENPSQEDDNPSQETSSKFIQEAYGEVYPKSSDDPQGSGSFSQQKIRDYKIPNRMPDIISEAELLRRQQMQIEQEIKQLEQSVPAVFLREIPNKPPPPYVPPAQDSPLATIFPSEERIVELVNNCTKELYASNQSEVDKTECHNITNVYEKIIVGMCEEIYGEIKETLDTQYDAPFQRVRLYRNKLAFFNPPDRLGCIQEHILESIGRIMPGTGNYPRQSLQLPANSRRKRDQIDEIVIEEMLEDDWKWSNFQIEETEVLDTMTETIFSTLLEDAIRDIDVAFTRKFPPNT